MVFCMESQFLLLFKYSLFLPLFIFPFVLFYLNIFCAPSKFCHGFNECTLCSSIYILSAKRFYVHKINANIREIFEQCKTILYITCLTYAFSCLYNNNVRCCVHISTLIIEANILLKCSYLKINTDICRHVKLNSSQKSGRY